MTLLVSYFYLYKNQYDRLCFGCFIKVERSADGCGLCILKKYSNFAPDLRQKAVVEKLRVESLGLRVESLGLRV